jgi:putative CocE/NonD family hydrolase
MRTSLEAFACLLVIVGCSRLVQAQPVDVGRQPTDVSFEWGVKIPMRDGAKLNATVYRPKDSSGPMPVIVTVTPYISDRYHPDAQYFARHGFAFVIVDTRGRGSSEGQFVPFINDADDGHDIVEWLGTQSWSNGKVAMRGGSYGGYNQWATAKEFPPHLVTIVPVAAAFLGTDFPMEMNVPAPYPIRWATLTSGRTANNRTFGDNDFWNRKFLEYHTSGMAFRDLAELVGNPSTEFDTWVDHPSQDAYWAAFNPTDDEFVKINMPVLTITGHYDGDQPGAMEFYKRHMQHASEEAKAKHYVIIGPWDHGGTRIPVQEFGGMRFGDAMMFDAFALDKDWYNWTMRDGPRPDFIKDRVTYFVAGNNEWKSAPSLEDVADRQWALHLSSNGHAGDVHRSGALDSAPAKGASFDRYVYDPLDTSKAERAGSPDYITDQEEVVRTNGDGLIYHSAPFDADTEVTGYIRFDAWIEMDVPDTDFAVTLYEILPDGGSIALTSHTQRARYRTSLDRETLITPGEINLYTFDRFWFFSRLVSKGSRLRLFIRPANRLEDQRNYNSGGVVADETAADARIATVKLYHDADHPSQLVLPIVDRQ